MILQGAVALVLLIACANVAGPAARARRRPPSRGVAAPGARRGPEAHRSPVPGREPAARGPWRCRRAGAFVGRAQTVRRDGAARLPAARSRRVGSAGPRVHGAAGGAHERAVRARAGAAGVEGRRRSAEGIGPYRHRRRRPAAVAQSARHGADSAGAHPADWRGIADSQLRSRNPDGSGSRSEKSADVRLPVVARRAFKPAGKQ